MPTTVTRRYHFESGHFLPKVHNAHKCKRPHGHNYEMEVTVTGPLLDNGFIIDFWDLDAIVKPILDRVDHRMLNDIDGLENPTAENIAHWFLNKLIVEDAHYLPHLWNISCVRIYETKDCWSDATAI